MRAEIKLFIVIVCYAMVALLWLFVDKRSFDLWGWLLGPVLDAAMFLILIHHYWRRWSRSKQS